MKRKTGQFFKIHIWTSSLNCRRSRDVSQSVIYGVLLSAIYNNLHVPCPCVVVFCQTRREDEGVNEELGLRSGGMYMSRRIPKHINYSSHRIRCFDKRAPIKSGRRTMVVHAYLGRERKRTTMMMMMLRMFLPCNLQVKRMMKKKGILAGTERISSAWMDGWLRCLVCRALHGGGRTSGSVSKFICRGGVGGFRRGGGFRVSSSFRLVVSV